MPIKTFVYFSPVEWLGRFLSRPGLEAEMDHSWSDAQNFRKSNPGLMRDIFDGDLLRNFKGPDGKHFSVGNGEGRYAFSLSVDFFNPLENKQAGKKISLGIITIVCLNLPPHLRYRSENIFLAGIIPGPNEPPLTAINHFLRPVVNDFLTMWSPGIYYSQTDGHPNGRLVRCAIVCVVCDLPAARKITGFVSFAHNHFCAICECTLKENGYHDFNTASWTRRTNKSCRRSAKLYRRAGVEHRQKLVDKTGVRWSELLRLPYFDPAQFVVVDPMHNLLLGLIHEHFTGVLGLSLPADKDQNPPVLRLPLSDSDAWMQLSNNEQKSWRRLIRWLEQPMNQELNTLEGYERWLSKLGKQCRSTLALLCRELQVVSVPSHPAKVGQATCKDFARGLLEWVCSLLRV
jgi:Transposase family tnp2